eukprot:PhM_4_TR4915/c0_g1_i1/m.97537
MPSSSSSTAASIRIITYNMLCPFYLRCKTFGTEAGRPDKYFSRIRASVTEVLSHEPDVLCLQEYPTRGLGLKSQLLNPLFDEHGFDGMYLPRTHRGARDGVAVLYNKRTLQLLEIHHIRLNEEIQDCDRVSMMVILRKIHDPRVRFAVVTTHLTFPHNKIEDARRCQQMAATMEYVQDRVDITDLPTVVCGDLNGERDTVTKFLTSNLGMVDAVEPVLQHHKSYLDILTHVDHEGASVRADHVFVTPNITPQHSVLLPEGVPPSHAFDRPVVGGDLQLFSNLSDHRPIVCDLGLPTKNGVFPKRKCA